jgi:exodeoxyribonuclease VII small subunit
MPKSDDYSTLNQKLDDILARLQQPDVKVDEAVELYEQGLKLAIKLEAHLKQAENKITRLKLQAAGE